MEWLLQYNIYVQGLIVSSIIISSIVVVIIPLSFFNIKIDKRKLSVLSIFTGGVLIIASIIGQLVTAKNTITVYFERINSSSGAINVSPSLIQSIFIILIFIIGFIVAGVVIWLTNIYSKYKNKNQVNENKSFKNSTIIILLHRLPAAIAIGSLIYQSNLKLPNGFAASPLSVATLIIFIVHIIPENIFLFYSFKEKNKSIKSVLFIFFVTFLFIPFILIGILINKSIPNNMTYFRVILFVATGTIIVWGVVKEIIPDVMYKRDKKEITVLLTAFISGMALSLLFQLIHIH